MEAADLIVVNKADGNLLVQAKHTKADYSSSMQFIRPKHFSWKASVLLMSARTGDGIVEVQNQIAKFHEIMSKNGQLFEKRRKQSNHWIWNQLNHIIINDLKLKVESKAKELEMKVTNGQLTPRAAALQLHQLYLNHSNK